MSQHTAGPKYTPGEWFVNQAIRNRLYVEARNPQGFVCDLQVDETWPDWTQPLATAHLIAASPELLAAARQSVELLEQRNHFGQGAPERNGLCGGQCCTSCDAHDRLLAAIAKAEGRSRDE